MKTKIDERKNIIVSLKSSYGEKNKGIEKRIHFLKLMSIINIILIIFSAGILFLSIVSEQFGIGFFKWEKMGLIAILSLSFVLNLPKSLYELKLLKHLIRINSKSEFNGIEKLNKELKNIIYQLNNGLKNNWHVFFLAIVIMIMGIWQSLYDQSNPYWQYMKIPVILFFGIIVVQFINTNKKISDNINETEKYLS